MDLSGEKDGGSGVVTAHDGEVKEGERKEQKGYRHPFKEQAKHPLKSHCYWVCTC